MPVLLANNAKVSEGHINLPLTGRLTATLRLAADNASASRGEAVVLRFESGETFATTCLDVGRDGGFWRLYVVGGAGKLDMRLRPKFYEGVPARTILLDMLQEVGEAPGSLDAPETFARYTRYGYPAWQELRRVLLLLPERNWRIMPDGGVWVGRETWPMFAEELRASRYDFVQRRHWFPLTPALQPGVRLHGVAGGYEAQFGPVERLTHHIGPVLRTEVICGK
ncbi:hypothetical protein [Meiothermus sp.]|uniref:hypothetical protein n=1 Tax=Meiothermus sp. TaxID=1955249 RepID=UPI00307D9B0E